MKRSAVVNHFGLETSPPPPLTFVREFTMPQCMCTSHGCKDRKHPKTGEDGWPLDAKNMKRHYRRDQEMRLQQQRGISADVERVALASQRAILAAQELEIEASFTSLSVSPTESQEAVVPKYRIDFKRALVADISHWQDSISEQTVGIEGIGMSPDGHVPRETVECALLGCDRALEISSEILGNIRRVRSGSLAKETSIQVLLDDTHQELNKLFARVRAISESWKASLRRIDELEEDASRRGFLVDSEPHFDQPLSFAHILVQLSSLMVVTCHVILGLPRRGCHWLFSMCAILIEATFKQVGAPSQFIAFFNNLLKVFPKDVRVATRNFRLDGKSTVYAACPKCHETYKPSGNDGNPIYPERCNSSRYSNRCGELLVRPKMVKGRRFFLPIKPYIVFDFQDWLGGLMSRTGYEGLMDAAWSRMDASRNGPMTDIFQGSVIREFKGPDGQTHFSKSGPDNDTARYLFSMGCDFFNPLRNLANGKRVSIGVIALVCLNLPISIRYKPENIFLASIIPGPKEPKLDAINPYVRPVVEVFQLFWQGVRYTRTALYQAGRWVLCALIAIICDLPAARKVAGFASCSHEYFCSLCWCNKTVHGYADYNYHTWEWRTGESCRDWAERYRSSATEKLAYSSFDKSGLRWSVLLHLPYFDPTKHLVVDPMHNLFLGLVKELFQGTLGYIPKGFKATTKKKNIYDLSVTVVPSATNPLPEKASEKASIRKILTNLRQPLPVDDSDQADKKALVDTLIRSHLGSLVYVGKGLNCIPDTVQPNGADLTENPANTSRPKKWTKLVLATAIAEWRIQQDSENPTSGGSPATSMYPSPGRVFTDEEMEVLWSDIESMVKPSWATSVPNNISSVGAKLKSDQWRSIGVLFLPVSLIRLWSNAQVNGEVEENPISKRRRELLHLTMLLCSAICIITSRTVSQEHSDLYLQYMTEFRKELQRIFPGYVCHPNHHMAMHVGEFVEKYGPMNGWWTFPFERMIGRLQRIMTNYKQGEYEATIGRSWTRSANFQALFLKSSCPPSIKACKEIFDKLVQPQNRNTLIGHLGSSSDEYQEEDNEELEDTSEMFSERPQSTLPAEVQQAFQSRHPHSIPPSLAIMKNRLTIDGVSYTTSEIHEGNSGILSCQQIPFKIVKVLEFPANHALGQHWFVVRRHQQANVAMDPYAAYPHIRAKLWGVDYNSKVEVIPFTDVETHFAKCEITWEEKEVAVIVSLSKTHDV